MYINIVLLIFVFFGLGCQAQNKVKNPTYDLMLQSLLSHTVEETKVEDLKTEKLEDYILLDAREKNEFEVSHMENAVWIGYDDFAKSRVADIPKDAKVLVYCSVGYRSEKITEKMLELGFEDVANLYGGLFEWVNQGNEVVNEKEEKTTQVHAYYKLWGAWLDTNKENKVYR